MLSGQEKEAFGRDVGGCGATHYRPYPRNFVVKKNMGAFSTMIPLSDRDLNL